MKKLYRKNQGRIFGGVCGGIADYLNVDPSVVRLLWVLLTLLSCGTGFIFYVVTLFILPDENMAN